MSIYSFSSKTFLTFFPIQILSSMRRSLALVITFSIMLQLVHLIPNVNPDDDETKWVENLTFEGSCSMDNVYKRFQVNHTVVEIIVNLSWVTGVGWANLDMWVQDTNGNHVDASYSEQMPEIMNIRNFPNRGRWTVVITPKSCGSCGYANYTLNITMHNIILPDFEISNTQIEVKENVTMDITSIYENVSDYFFDFGDGTDSGWVVSNSTFKIYNKSGEYLPKAKVRYIDGTESDWVEAGSIEVKSEEKEPCLILWIIIWLGFLTLVIFLITILHDRKKEI